MSHTFLTVSSWRKATISRATVLGATACFSVGIISSSPVVAAQSSTAHQQEINKQLTNLRGQMTEATSDQVELLDKIDKLNKAKADLDARTADVQSQVAATQANLDQANARLQETQVRVNRAQGVLDEANKRLKDNAEKLQTNAVDAYMGSEENSQLSEMLLRGESVRGIAAAQEYRSQIVTDRKEVVEQQRELEAKAKDAKAEIDAIYVAAKADRDSVAQSQADLVAQKNQLVSLKKQADDEAARESDLMQEIEAKRVTIQQQMNSLQAQSDAIARTLREASSGTGGNAYNGTRGTPIVGSGQLSTPIPGAIMTSPFGMRGDPILGSYSFHPGQDYGVPIGTPIRAGADGKVIAAMSPSQSGGYGNFVCIDHGSGLATCYAHQNSLLVSVGQVVTRGQIIGLSGNTGYSTGPHLHFEVRVNGSPVNPAAYL